ncbi:cell division protein ZapA [bacterium]|nr:cell division protein ZapA [candidate division CSSED10-310 bacterium]
MPHSKVEVEIFGNHYHIVADDDPSRILDLAHSVNERMQDIARMNPGMASAKVAILAALNFAAQAAGLQCLCNLVAQRSDNLIQLISDELTD